MVKSQITVKLKEETRRLSDEMQRKVSEIKRVSREKRGFEQIMEKCKASLQEIEKKKNEI